MSSFLQKDLRTEFAVEGKDKTAVLPCPECGQISMIRTKGDCKLKDGFMVPDLERWQCSSCKANFFEVEDLHIIADFRAKTQQ